MCVGAGPITGFLCEQGVGDGCAPGSTPGSAVLTSSGGFIAAHVPGSKHRAIQEDDG
jgi:hypothetical protein